ncbi:hypothetical protein LTR95_017774 [Oleoguttula sp. CCFEE 5521]
MDRSLDEIISERPARRGGRGGDRNDRGDRGDRADRGDRRAPPPRAPRREEYPRDGVRKPRREEAAHLDTDWVHDRFEEDRYDRRGGRGGDYGYDDRAPPAAVDTRAREPSEAKKIRVDNIHYDIQEKDIKELFERIGPVETAQMLYDRMDRSQGTAFITYVDARDARDALREYDGANAHGQPIRLTLLPTGPATGPRAAPSKGSLFERVERPARSLFDRIDNGPSSRDDSREPAGRRGGRGGRPDRSYSPEKDRLLRVPDNIDRYVPGQRDSRSPVGRGGGRERGRRPGARREEGTRGGGRGGRGTDGAPRGGGRRGVKTAEQLDAEMDDYFGGGGGAQNGGAEKTQNGSTTAAAMTATAAPVDDDIDMIE